jgi:hypothetical protein
MKKIIFFTILLLFGAHLSQTIAQVCPVLTEPGAISTGSNTPAEGSCDPNTQIANNDAKVDFTGIANSDKVEKWEGATYAGVDYSSATGSIVGGAVSFTGLKHATSYTFRFWNVNNACYMDVVVTTPAKNCNIPCTPPSVGANTPAIGTCTGTTPNDDATLTFADISNVDKAEKWEGATYGGAAYAAATETVTGSSKTFTGLKHNTTYTFRFWNGNNLCYTDVIRTTPPSDCTINPIVCVNLLDGPVCCPAKICLPVLVKRNN